MNGSKLLKAGLELESIALILIIIAEVASRTATILGLGMATKQYAEHIATTTALLGLEVVFVSAIAVALWSSASFDPLTTARSLKNIVLGTFIYLLIIWILTLFITIHLAMHPSLYTLVILMMVLAPLFTRYGEGHGDAPVYLLGVGLEVSGVIIGSLYIVAYVLQNLEPLHPPSIYSKALVWLSTITLITGFTWLKLLITLTRVIKASDKAVNRVLKYGSIVVTSTAIPLAVITLFIAVKIASETLLNLPPLSNIRSTPILLGLTSLVLLSIGLAISIVGGAKTFREAMAIDAKQMKVRTEVEPSEHVATPQPTKAARKCPYCGKEIPADAIFCPYCGAYLGGDEGTKVYVKNEEAEKT
jgi:hypothetical protein